MAFRTHRFHASAVQKVTHQSLATLRVTALSEGRGRVFGLIGCSGSEPQVALK